MLISLELDEDRQFPSVEACRRWIASFPGLAKSVKVDGVYRGYSTVLILSVPVVIWNTLPEHPACRPITYVTSRNLLQDNQSHDTSYTISVAIPDSKDSTKRGHPDSMNSRHAPVLPVDAEEEKFRPIPSDVLDDSNLQQTAADIRPKSPKPNAPGYTESNISVAEDLISSTGSFHLSRQKDTFSDSLPTEGQVKPLQDQLPEAPDPSIPDNTDDQPAHPPPRDIDGRLPLSLLARMDDVPDTDHKEGSVRGQCETPTLDPAPKLEIIVSETSSRSMAVDGKNKLIGSQLGHQMGMDFPQELFNQGIRKNTNENDSSSKIPERLPAPEKLLVTEADGKSRSEELSGSEEDNEYETLVSVKDIDGNMAQTLVAFDTSAQPNFITSNALANIGRFKIRPIQASRIRRYCGLGEGMFVPRSFIVVNISKEEIGLRGAKVRLKVVDHMDDLGGAQIILRRRFILKHGEGALLRSVFSHQQRPEVSKSDHGANLRSQSNPLTLQAKGIDMDQEAQKQENRESQVNLQLSSETLERLSMATGESYVPTLWHHPDVGWSQEPGLGGSSHWRGYAIALIEPIDTSDKASTLYSLGAFSMTSSRSSHSSLEVEGGEDALPASKI